MNLLLYVFDEGEKKEEKKVIWSGEKWIKQIPLFASAESLLHTTFRERFSRSKFLAENPICNAAQFAFFSGAFLIT